MKGETKMTNYCVVYDKKLIGFIVNSDDLKYAKDVATNNFKQVNPELIEIELIETFHKMFHTCSVDANEANLTDSSKIKLFDLGISKNNESEQLSCYDSEDCPDSEDSTEQDELSCYDSADYSSYNPYNGGSWWK